MSSHKEDKSDKHLSLQLPSELEASSVATGSRRRSRHGSMITAEVIVTEQSEGDEPRLKSLKSYVSKLSSTRIKRENYDDLQSLGAVTQLHSAKDDRAHPLDKVKYKIPTRKPGQDVGGVWEWSVDDMIQKKRDTEGPRAADKLRSKITKHKHNHAQDCQNKEHKEYFEPKISIKDFYERRREQIEEEKRE